MAKSCSKCCGKLECTLHIKKKMVEQCSYCKCLNNSLLCTCHFESTSPNHIPGVCECLFEEYKHVVLKCKNCELAEKRSTKKSRLLRLGMLTLIRLADKKGIAKFHTFSKKVIISKLLMKIKDNEL